MPYDVSGTFSEAQDGARRGGIVPGAWDAKWRGVPDDVVLTQACNLLSSLGMVVDDDAADVVMAKAALYWHDCATRTAAAVASLNEALMVAAHADKRIGELVEDLQRLQSRDRKRHEAAQELLKGIKLAAELLIP